MILLTSLSPSHKNKDIQQQCVDSWVKLGIKAVSLNCKNELDSMDYKNIHMIDTNKTMELHYNKPYVSVSAILEYAKEQKEEDYFCICNSDIQFNCPRLLLDRIKEKMNNSIVIGNRVDYDNSFEDGNMYLHGLDVFFIHRKFLDAFPPNNFALGQCHWDFWIPYKACSQNIEVNFLDNKFAFHKRHELQYDKNSWIRTGKELIQQEGLYKYRNNVPQMSGFVYNYFTKKSNRITL